MVPKGYCINLLNTLWTRDKSWIDATVVNHERIHTAQQKELLFLPFYLVYVLEWLVRIAITRDWQKAYRSISFEREAYANAKNQDYLATRRMYAQWRGGEKSMDKNAIGLGKE